MTSLLNSQLQNTKMTHHQTSLSQTLQLNDITLSVSEVSNIIRNLDKSKKPLVLTKSITDYLLSPLLSLLNLLRYYLTDLSEKASSLLFEKFRTLPPCTKKGPKEFCNNYRPISLLSCIGKVLEKCIHKHVYNFLQYNNIITQSQSGFIPGDSTVN